MRTIWLAAGLLAAGTSAALSATAWAQGDPPVAAAPACYIEVHRLMAEPPAGIAELGAAIRGLDAALRPQVEEIKVLKAQIARLQRQAESSTEPAIEQVSLDDTALASPFVEDAAAEELMRLQAELGSRQDKLKSDYAAQQETLVGPVQARISRGAQGFAAVNGCADVKMARTPDLPALAGAGARNVTAEFVTWYIANPPA